MYALETYEDVKKEIEISKIRIQGLKDERKLLEKSLQAPGELRAMVYSDMPKGNNSPISLDRLIPRLNVIDIKLEREEMILKHNLNQLELINTQLKGLKGLQYEVYKLRYIDRLTVFAIAERLGIGTTTVDRIIAKIKREKKEHSGVEMV